VDAYLGGERSGGKSGRGSENKVPFIAALQTSPAGHPLYACLAKQPFTTEAVAVWAAKSLATSAHVVSDGLGCFRGVKIIGAEHDPTARASATPCRSCKAPSLKAPRRFTYSPPRRSRRTSSQNSSSSTRWATSGYAPAPMTATRRAMPAKRCACEATSSFPTPSCSTKESFPITAKWAQFFERLRYVIIDEMHTYRGVFGSHMVNVIRRLRRMKLPERLRAPQITEM
jgi:hypothetical protein